jgi:hypothetical protein
LLSYFQLEFTNWEQQTYEPNGDDYENCLMVWADTHGTYGPYKWNDAPCQDSFEHFICEKPQEDVQGPKTDKWIGLNDIVSFLNNLQMI